MGKKRKIYERIELTDLGDKGLCIGRDEKGEVVMVNGGVPGDVVRALSKRKRKGVAQGQLLKVLEESPHRCEPICKHFDDCGGCKWQHLEYSAQLEYKNKIVLNAIRRIAGCDPERVEAPVPANELTFFRNKLEFTFSDKRWITLAEAKDELNIKRGGALGFHRPGAFDKVVDIDECWLQKDPSNSIRNFVKKYAVDKGLTFFNLREHNGLLRNLMIRTGRESQLMVLLSFGEEDKDAIEALLKSLIKNFPQITSLFYVINTKGNDTILDLPLHHFFGSQYIEEKLNDVVFRIGPKSFFQTNPGQAEVLFDLALSFADIKNDSLVYDLYCGIGSISLMAAKAAKKVLGIELVPEAIQDAEINARLNNIDNVEFIVSEVEKILDDSFFNQKGKPDIIIVDPPRAGLHKNVVEAINNSKVEKVVYVSCNPSTQARDIGLMKNHYSLERIRTVDMFPYTSHIETVALLKIK
ncbi:MAG: 23S rRNA (uracil(1939)-C(5))-methyltransferase RlmD [Saprospirales bacterium]|nr:MAG: 23S rRNA (uracil(1939)-C(5))-methyltransferase RlmD [Saprospirales bacterium]